MTLPALAALLARPDLKQLLALLNQGGEARLIGGAVRNALLGKAVEECDLATSHLPGEVTARLEAAGIRVIPTGLSHGTVTARVAGVSFEITTLRRDITTDGRHAEVAFTDDWREDAARRDFTVNAMSCDAEGRIYDYFTGRKDLAEGLLRFVGVPATRIREDALRILRFFRFAACYGFRMEGRALAACGAEARLIDRLSGERVQQEMLRLLGADDPVPVLTVMGRLEILPRLLPGVPFRTLPQLPSSERERLSLRRLALLLRGGGADQAAVLSLARRWKLANQARDYLTAMTITPPLTANLAVAEQKKRLRAHPFFYRENLILSAAEQPSPAFAPLLDLAESWTPPIFPITGHDLTPLGITPGPELGKWLKTAESWWEESDYRLTKEQLLRKIEEEG